MTTESTYSVSCVYPAEPCDAVTSKREDGSPSSVQPTVVDCVTYIILEKMCNVYCTTISNAQVFSIV